MVRRETVESWLSSLKKAWEAGDSDAAIKLFSHTKEYYERPFAPGTTQVEIRNYWADIQGLRDIKFDYAVSAVEGQLGVVHWRNSFVTPDDDKTWLLDGIFYIEFDDEGRCVVFRQWWFAAD